MPVDSELLTKKKKKPCLSHPYVKQAFIQKQTSKQCCKEISGKGQERVRERERDTVVLRRGNAAQISKPENTQ